MITNVSWYDFSDWFLKSDTYKNNFSYEGLKALFDYLEELEESTGEQINFDPIALCCEYSEYDSADDAAKEYFDYEGMTLNEDGGELETADQVEAKALKYLEDRTTVINCDNGHIIIAEF